jgi:hypothetical protein
MAYPAGSRQFARDSALCALHDAFGRVWTLERIDLACRGALFAPNPELDFGRVIAAMAPHDHAMGYS